LTVVARDIRSDHPLVLGPFGEAVWFAAAVRDCLRMVTRYFTPSMVRSAVTTAIRIGGTARPAGSHTAASPTSGLTYA